MWRGIAFAFAGMAGMAGWSSAQTVEVVGNASATANARVPVINDAGNVFYVNGGTEVIGNPATPILKSFLPVTSFLAPGGGGAVPYVLSSNGNVTYLTPTTLTQSNGSQNAAIAVGNAQASGLSSTYKYAYDSFSKVSGVFDYGVSEDGNISFRAEVSSNNFFNSFLAVYVGPPSSFNLLMDSFHAVPGLPSEYVLDNQGYFHALRNKNGLSLLIGHAHSTLFNPEVYGLWLHDAVNGLRLAVIGSPLIGTTTPGDPTGIFTYIDFGLTLWPGMDDEGRFAFTASGSAFPRNIYGVYAGLENNLRPVATNGMAVPGIPGTYFTNFGNFGPVHMGTGGKLVVAATIAGTGVYSTNSQVLIFGSSPGDLKVIARSGTVPPGMPAGVVWTPSIIDISGQTENPVSYPLNDQLVMFGNNRVAFVGQVVGPGITSSPSTTANDSGIWVSDDNGGTLSLLTRRGSVLATTSGNRTPTNYFGLQGGCAGRDGKPSGSNRVGQLTFVNGVTTYRVTYPPPLTAALNKPVLVAGQMQVAFATVSGKTYHLQVNTNLATTNWTDVQVYTGDDTTKTNLVTPSGARGFYRLFVP